ncbi:putative Zn-binding protein involved in type VI secretion [Enterobacter sp. BIGb0383]|uniref:PAAR domain-containing protein n=1 Tax=unclassified Enterobacter TaxID=2608935 RepID=UPI000F4709EB|nr:MULTISPECIES: PAAR domain-containing protein [unclassified Enterobacter]ROP61545.1 putative Zn-binding protein involved in type VI secretion [Enterobacter sp. BIGb0383]ROS11706.1 putative Zn-binding protein involved in type VI secretion [Enterobacter sp. BIGb0359]
MGTLKKIVRQGDTLREYGGTVLSGKYLAFGKPIARVGDAVRCNMHGMTTIAEGAAGTLIEGKAVALDGHRCACGCTLVSSLQGVDIAP